MMDPELTVIDEGSTEDGSKADDNEDLLRHLIQMAVSSSRADAICGIISNSLFITGSCLYIGIAVWESAGVPLSFERGYQLYMSVYLLAPLFYFGNGVVDILWALRTRRQEQYQLKVLDTVNGGGSNRNIKAGSSNSIGLKGNMMNILQRLTRRVTNRRVIAAAATFTIASAFGISEALAIYNNHAIAKELDFIALHFYISSAVFSLCGKRDSRDDEYAATNIWSDANKMKVTGDILFGLGSMVDMVIFHTAINDAYFSWPVFGAFLWLLDGLVYLRADHVVYSTMQASISPAMRAGSQDAMFGISDNPDDYLICDNAKSARRRQSLSLSLQLA